MASTASLEKAWELYKELSFASETKSGSLEISSDEIEAIVKEAKDLATVISILANTVSLKKSYRVSRILETSIAGALSTGASDIHIEPEETYVRLRYRLDGVLVEIIRFDTETYDLLLSRIKLLSGMKLNLKKQSQDGRFSIHVNNSDIEMRVSVLPGAYNESIVMRILDPKSISVPLESLGIPPKLLAILVKGDRQAERHDPDDRPDRFRQDDDLVCVFEKVIQSRGQDNHHRRPCRIPFARHHTDPGQRQRLQFPRGSACGGASGPRHHHGR